MMEIEFLNWVRGPGMQIALAIFLIGMAYRLLENYLIGRAKMLADPKGDEWRHGVNTVWRRSSAHPNLTTRGHFTLVSGYIFHLAFLITLFFFAQHIEMFRSLIGFGWPALPPLVITITAVLGIASLIAVLVHRITDPVKRMLSDFQDYLTWLLTFLPLITGFLLITQSSLPYKGLLAAHILSFELLLVAIPLTKLSHMITVVVARWYNGAIAGYKGVQS
ncbi:MAG: hypothetical protein OEQ18_07055 [Gammaproteobacteria bacterium]|nr:hypothetical protein [Gammaproteobacteria bacterium]